MKKCAISLMLLLMAFGTTLNANQPAYYTDNCQPQTCYDPCDPCAPCAPTCGTSVGMNWASIGVAVPVVIAIIAGVAGGDNNGQNGHN